ncbi:MAG: OmpA family protein [Colwellia sp.]
MQESPSTEQVESEQQFQQLRQLILGKDSHLVTDTVKKHARNIVTDVLTEAIHDRQKKDGSVNKVLLPLVEDSVKYSVTHHSDRLVNSLYPLMGGLVRKSVTAFLTGFMEKTNQLIENSLTIQGVKWRIQAWQLGVSFAQYVASQTFIYRVEHVFIIHGKTSLLLNSVAFNNSDNTDIDLISSMLVAINDFVGDSFLADIDGQHEKLQTVSTDNFTLLIKTGPSALIVAAVTGKPPQAISNQLQLTLEEFHHLYIDELAHFDGDNQYFENSESLLQDCLLSEQKTAKKETKKASIFTWFLVFSAIFFLGFYLVAQWQNQQLKEKIMLLDDQAGVVVRQLSVEWYNEVNLNVLRDPDAVSIEEWFEQHNLPIEQLNVSEQSYRSLEPELLKTRALQILAHYPNIKSEWKVDTLFIFGTIDIIKKEKLLNSLLIVGFKENNNLNSQQLKLTSSAALADSKLVKQNQFNDLVGRVSSMQLDFDTNSDVITSEMKMILQQLYHYVYQLNLLADDLNLIVGLLVMGTSDASGMKETNMNLSYRRAENTANTLNQLGLNKEQMYVTGLGHIKIKKVENTSRKVMFNIIYVGKVNVRQ